MSCVLPLASPFRLRAKSGIDFPHFALGLHWVLARRKRGRRAHRTVPIFRRPKTLQIGRRIGCVSIDRASVFSRIAPFLPAHLFEKVRNPLTQKALRVPVPSCFHGRIFPADCRFSFPNGTLKVWIECGSASSGAEHAPLCSQKSEGRE